MIPSAADAEERTPRNLFFWNCWVDSFRSLMPSFLSGISVLRRPLPLGVHVNSSSRSLGPLAFLCFFVCGHFPFFILEARPRKQLNSGGWSRWNLDRWKYACRKIKTGTGPTGQKKLCVFEMKKSQSSEVSCDKICDLVPVLYLWGWGQQGAETESRLIYIN